MLKKISKYGYNYNNNMDFSLDGYSLSAKSAILIEAQTGRVLFELDSHTVR